jgi:hypothetical protein
MEPKFARRATEAWRLRRQRHIGSSCDSPELLAPHYARLPAPGPSGAAAFGRSIAASDDSDAASASEEAPPGSLSAGASGASAAFLTGCDAPGTRDWPLPGPIQVPAPDPVLLGRLKRTAAPPRSQ